MKEYYIVSVKHTSKGDTALTFWGANGAGYTWDKKRAGIYLEDVVDKYTSDDNVKVLKEVADPLWLKAYDYGDIYTSIPNNPQVLHQLGLSDKLMKPKKFASCRMRFSETHQLIKTGAVNH
jgi:hypothetical protein